MKFIHIELENIFAYSRKVVLDVSQTTPDKNLILIWGRNGMGKTSLLNAIKLLFLGAENKKIRTVGFPPRTLGHRQFVLGDGSGWSGLINRRAYSKNPDTVARVLVKWESDERTISAERQWRSNNVGYQESLILYDGENRLSAAAAEERLQDFLPRDFVDIFFFDGEEIKAMAEMSEGRKAVDFDKVLGMSFISELANEVSQISNNKERERLSAEVREEITEVENEIHKSQAIQDTAEEQILHIRDLLVDKNIERRQLQARLDNLRSGASPAEREALERYKKNLSEELKILTSDIYDTVPAVSPILTNRSLVKVAIQELDNRLKEIGSTEHNILKRIQDQLPGWVKEGPPKLNQKTAEAIARSLINRLKKFKKSTSVTGLFARMDTNRAFYLRDELKRFLGPDQYKVHSRMLQTARRTRLELQRIRESLMELEVGSESTLEEFRKITKKLEEVDEEISTLNQQLGQHEARSVEAQKNENHSKDRRKYLEQKHKLAKLQSQDAIYIRRVARSLNELREELRISMKERVRNLINEKYRILVYDYNLVHKIELDETYTLTYQDAQGVSVGRSSLSSGLKQLAATALLWAMKDATEHEVPVIIDTPLGRIDRENQDNMLSNYYPNLAEQLIVLPTNAEIDHRKYHLIRERIAREYTIKNDSGEDASIQIGSLIN